MKRRSRLLNLTALAAFLLLPRGVVAHPLAPSLLNVRELGDGVAEIRWKVSRTQPPGAAVRPLLPERCRAVGARQVEQDEASVTWVWAVDCGAESLVGERIGVSGLDDGRVDALLRLRLADGRLVRTLLNAQRSVWTVPERDAAIDVAGDYVRLGFRHMLGGPDHLAFVFGLFLLVRSRRTLLLAISAFTLGHSVTLSLGVLGFVGASTVLIELGIALTILVLAAELGRGDAMPASTLRRRPGCMSFVFGLLHGLGFAAALHEAGLPAAEVPVALASFNVGVEAAQIAFVAGCLLVCRTGGAFLATLPPWVRWLPTYAVGSLAVFWCVDRGSALFWGSL
jgi:hydrogenase/urease accessory protein HupE